jgi:LacI family transcriptional regulator
MVFFNKNPVRLSHSTLIVKSMQGYKDALEKHHIPLNESLIKYCNHGGMIAAEIEEAISELFKGKNKPDAIFTASDRITTVCFAG